MIQKGIKRVVDRILNRQNGVILKKMWSSPTVTTIVSWILKIQTNDFVLPYRSCRSWIWLILLNVGVGNSVLKRYTQHFVLMFWRREPVTIMPQDANQSHLSDRLGIFSRGVKSSMIIAKSNNMVTNKGTCVVAPLLLRLQNQSKYVCRFVLLTKRSVQLFYALFVLTEMPTSL